MRLSKRLAMLEEKLNKDRKLVFRFTGCDWHYPEEEEDKAKNLNVVKICVEGRSCEELRSWVV